MSQLNPNYSEQIQRVLSLADSDGFFECPIDLNIKCRVDIDLPDLQWHDYDKKASKIKLTNSARTVILAGKWDGERPYITSGPLTEKYIFSQMHFHWGNNDNEGSQHTVEGHRFPLELHLVHFKCTHSNQEEALKEKDGLVVMVYLFMLQDNNNSKLSSITDALVSVVRDHASTYIVPSPLIDYLQPFENNYFMYWGKVSGEQCDHQVLWFICREAIGVSRTQLSKFRKLRGINDQTMDHVFQGVHPLNNRSLFLVKGAKPLDTTVTPGSCIQRFAPEVPRTSVTTGALLQAAEYLSVDDEFVTLIPRTSYNGSEVQYTKERMLGSGNYYT